jgi:hypothetical protein
LSDSEESLKFAKMSQKNQLTEVSHSSQSYLIGSFVRSPVYARKIDFS